MGGAGSRIWSRVIWKKVLSSKSPPASERRVARLVDVEDLVQSRDLEDLRDVAVAADEGEPATVRPQALDAANEDPERGRVDERRLREIDDDLLGPLPDHLEQ